VIIQVDRITTDEGESKFKWQKNVNVMKKG